MRVHLEWESWERILHDRYLRMPSFFEIRRLYTGFASNSLPGLSTYKWGVAAGAWAVEITYYRLLNVDLT